MILYKRGAPRVLLAGRAERPDRVALIGARYPDEKPLRLAVSPQKVRY